MMLKHEIDSYGDHSTQLFSSDDEAILLVRSAFKAFEGNIAASPYIRIGLNLAGGGQVKRRTDNRLNNIEWRRGFITVWSGQACYAKSPTVDMLGLALNIEALNRAGYTELSRDKLQVPPCQTLHDEFLSAMLLALWRSAQIYGVSTHFFKQGVLQILQRLSVNNPSGSQLPNRRPLTNRALARVQAMVNENLQSDLSVAEMADLLKMDKTSFAKSFTRSTGLTPFAYITSKRIEAAQKLLKQELSITDVATTVGYANPSKFAAAFRRCTGMNPSAWRRNN